MSNITDWIKYELYPSLFESMDIALPELKLTRAQRGNKWISSLNRDGTTPAHTRGDKTVIKGTAPGLIIENGERGAIGVIDYVMERDRVEFIKAVETLAEVVGLKLPPLPDQEGYQRYRDQAGILEACNSYFVYCLENSKGAEAVRNYLRDRGYSPEEVKDMELGYIPSQEKLFKYLSKNYSQGLIEEAVRINIDTRIGSTHKLTIPYRSGGSIRGFKFRTVGTYTPKYLNSSGLDRLGGFFNLSGIKGDKDIVIVEGELDSLHATVKGVNNVVSTGGNSINPEQIKDAKRRGARSFTLCFDRETGKEDETAKRINSAIEVILGEGVNRVYIVTLPDQGGGKTDPDSLLKESGADSFKKAIAEALPYYEYRLQSLLHKYGKIEEERGLQPKDIDNFLDEVIEGSVKLEPTDKDRYLRLFTSMEGIKELGITEESLAITVERLSSTRAKEKQSTEVKKLLSEAKELQDKGETDKALELLEGKVKEVKTITTSGILPPVMSFKALLDEIFTIPPAYKTGYKSLDEFIGFTPGAITLIAGRPSHGKTTLLYNLLLEMSRLYPKESFYYFTYEEPVKNLSIKLLNRLTDTDLSRYNTGSDKNRYYEFIKAYIRAEREDIQEIEEGKRKLQELIDSQRIKIIDRNYSVEELYSLIAYLRKKEKIGAIIIDYIQRMRTERKTQDKRTEIAHISDQVLQIAKDSGLPVILGAQLNREGKGEYPKLENLKEAGNLEEDANTVISVYCKAREDEEAGKRQEEPVDLELRTLKNREGEVNRAETLSWNRRTGVIRDKDNSSGYNPF